MLAFAASNHDCRLFQELRTMSICISNSGQGLADYISTGWTEAADIHQAQDLFAALSQQHEACAESLALKDSLLAAMKGALTPKEGKYVQTVGMHGKVICTPCLLITITHFTNNPALYLFVQLGSVTLFYDVESRLKTHQHDMSTTLHSHSSPPAGAGRCTR